MCGPSATIAAVLAAATSVSPVILDAVSTGVIPPDVGALLVQAAKYTIDIEQATELKDRMDKIEIALGING